jgi:hypothetical protein
MMDGVRKRIEGLWAESREEKARMVVKGATRWVMKVSDHASGSRAAIEPVGAGEAGRIIRETSRGLYLRVTSGVDK